MRQSTALKRLYKIIDERRRQSTEESSQLERDNDRDIRRRSRGADRVLSRVLAKAAKQTGVDYDRIEKLHKQDTAAAHAFQDKQQVKLRKLTKLADQRALRESRRTRLFLDRLNYTKGNPNTRVCLTTADRITSTAVLTGDGAFDPVHTSKTAGRNLWRSKIHASHGSVSVSTYFDFVWNSTLDGTLSAISAVTLNGSFSLMAPGSCWHDYTSTCGIVAFLDIDQMNRSGDHVGVGTPVPLLLDKRVTNGCYAKSKAGTVPQSQLIAANGPTAFPVVAGAPLIASIYFNLSVTGQDKDCRAQLNFLSATGITVLGIWLSIDH